MEEVLSHPHMAEREAFSTIPYAARGEVPVTSAPFFVDGAAVHAKGPAPYRPGEYTRAVLGALVEAGVVAVP